MKKLIALCAMTLLLCSCAGVNVKKPDIGSVKKIAILGVTSPEEYKDIESTKEKKKSLLATVAGNLLADNVEMLTDAQVEVITYGAKALTNTFNGISGWSVIPMEDVTSNEEVRHFYGDDKSTMEAFAELFRSTRYVTPKGMSPILYEQLNPRDKHWVNGVRVDEAYRRSIGKLCETLDVDAIAVAEYNFFYEKGMMTNITNNVTTYVFVDVVLVDKNGEMLLYTDRGWEKFEGDDNAHYSSGHLDYGASKTIAAYKSNIDKAMSEFKKQADKKIGR